MKRIVIIIICLFVLANVSGYFAVARQAPEYTVFTGAVHYPPDYLYYLSFITQGREHWLSGANLKSGDTTSLDYLNWIYVLGGHIGSLAQIPPHITYQLLVVVNSILYLVVAYVFMRVLLPAQPTARLVAYVLFLLSNAFPRIYQDHGTWIFSFFYPFNNLGHPFNRLTNVPHHLFIHACIMAAFATSLYYWQKRSRLTVAALAVLGIFLASMQPLQWAFIIGVLGISGLFSWWKSRIPGTAIRATDLISACLPAIALGITGLPVAMYLKHLFASPLYTFMLQWERDNQIIITLIHFIRLNGPVMLLGVIGLPFMLRSVTVTTFPLYLYSILSVALFFSPIPARLGYMNLRFVSVITTFTASYISAVILWKLARRFAPAQKKAFTWFAAFVLLAITFPVTYSHLTLDRAVTTPQDLNIFLPLGAYQTYQVALRTVKPDEVTLVTPLFTLSYPAITGRHVFSADAFGTLNFAKKGKEAVDFFNAVEPDDKRIAWLRNNKISYIFTYAWTPIDLPVLSVAYKNDYAILYKIAPVIPTPEPGSSR